MVEDPEQTDGTEQKPEPKTPRLPAKLASIGTFLAGLAALTASTVAILESRRKASEDVTKAAHGELVKRLEALASDLEAQGKQMERRLKRMSRRLSYGVLRAQAQADSVRALFTGYAMAAKRGTRESAVTIQKLIRKLSEAKARARDKPVPAAVGVGVQRTYRKPKSWDGIKTRVNGAKK